MTEMPTKGRNMKIITQHVFPPIPCRHFDWCAYIDGREEDSWLYGWGTTERAALDQLNLMVDERDDDLSLSEAEIEAFADAWTELKVEGRVS
jgi:hypothetical protein